MDTTQNIAFIDQIKIGDEKAFRDVFDLYYRELVIASYKLLKDENLCRDAVQEVFLELWKNRHKLHHKIQLLPYLKRSVMNRSINIIKSRKHHISSGPEPLQYLRDSQRRPDEQHDDKEFRTFVMNAIDRMPDRCRVIFMMKRMEGYSHDEIANKLGISKKTIENQITKAVKLLREEVNNYRQTLVSMIAMIFWMEWGIYHFHLFV